MNWILLTILLATQAVWAQSTTQWNDLNQRLEALEKKQKAEAQALTDEIARIKAQSAIPTLNGSSFMGLGQGASKVYFNTNPLSIGGYGEIFYADPRGGTTGNTTDNYRFVPYFSYRFSDKIIFNSEVEFEHSNQVMVEFFYLDFIIAPGVGIRAGQMLLPVGMVNLKHEPTYFHSILRPEIETKLIPSTWHENGLMLFAERGPWRLQAGVVNGFEASQAPSASDANSWVRNFRQRGSQAKAEDLGYFARVDWTPRSEIEIGASHYQGNSGQGVTALGDATIQITEAHLRWARFGWEVDALWAMGSLTDVNFTVPGSGVLPGKQVEGSYYTLAYDLFRGQRSEKLKLFTRYTSYDLQKKIQSNATSRDRSLDKEIWTLGVNYFPHPQVVVKADFEIRDNAAGDEDDIMALGLGLVF